MSGVFARLSPGLGTLCRPAQAARGTGRRGAARAWSVCRANPILTQAATEMLCELRRVPFSLWASEVPPTGGAGQTRASLGSDPEFSLCPGQPPSLHNSSGKDPRGAHAPPPGAGSRLGSSEPGSLHHAKPATRSGEAWDACTEGGGAREGRRRGWRRPQTEGDY